MVRPVCLVLAALCLAPQEPEKDEPSVEQEIAALIAKTNALETFHAIYDVEGTGEIPKVSWEVVYRAPDLGCVRAIVPDAAMEFWEIGDSLYRGYVTETGQSWQRASLPGPFAGSKELDELFPDETMLAPGVIFHATMDDSDDTRPVFNIRLQRPRDRTQVLSWLKEMQDQPADVSIEGDALVWTFASGRCFISRKTGFVQSVEYTTTEPYSVQLRELQCDETLAPSLVTLPEEAEDADEDPSLLAGREQLRTAKYMRWTGFLRVEKQLRSGRRAWDEGTRTGWRTFLTTMQREALSLQYSTWVDDLHRYIETVATWAAAQRAKDDSTEHLAAVERAATERRSELERNFDRSLEEYDDALTSIEYEGLEPRQELYDVERAVISDLYDELVRQPILTLFDEKLAAALEK